MRCARSHRTAWLAADSLLPVTAAGSPPHIPPPASSATSRDGRGKLHSFVKGKRRAVKRQHAYVVVAGLFEFVGQFIDAFTTSAAHGLIRRDDHRRETRRQVKGL